MSIKLNAAKLARRLTGRFTFKKRLPSEFGGASIHVTSRSDVRLLAPGFATSSLDLFIIAGRCINLGDCVWDIGANLGIFGFCAAAKAGPNGKVFTLEADPFYAELQHKSARNLPPTYAPVTPLCAAAADKFSILELAIPKRGQSRNHLRIVAGNDAGETESLKQVVTITGDFLLAHWPRPDFVKIDIEGAELLFFVGAKKLLSEVRPTIYLEASESNQSTATEILLSNGYKLFRLNQDGKLESVNRCDFNTLAIPSKVC